MRKCPSCYWVENTEEDFVMLRKASKGVALLPLGSIESHGPHLPVGTDAYSIEEVMRRVAARETVAILPTLAYSYVASARRRPGAIHVKSDVLMAHMEGICDEVYRNGFSKIVLAHGHGIDVVHGAFIRRMFERRKPYATYSIPAVAAPHGEAGRLFGEGHGGHAGTMETSMIMAAAPDLVRLERIKGKKYPPGNAPDVSPAITPVDWTARVPKMVSRKPETPDSKRGGEFLQAWAENIVRTIRKIKRDQVTPSVMRDYAREVDSPGG